MGLNTSTASFITVQISRVEGMVDPWPAALVESRGAWHLNSKHRSYLSTSTEHRGRTARAHHRDGLRTDCSQPQASVLCGSGGRFDGIPATCCAGALSSLRVSFRCARLQILPCKMLTDYDLLRSLATGTSVLISGVWQPAPPGKEQAYELKADEVRIIGSTDAEVSAKCCSPEHG